MADWLRVGLCLVVSGQLMVLSLALNLSNVDAVSRMRIGMALLVLTALGMALLGPELFRASRQAWARGDVSLEAMFSLAIVGGLAASLWGLFHGGPVFFEVVTVVLAIHALGARLKQRFWSTATDRIAAQWLPIEVERITAHRSEHVPLVSLRVGDHVRTHAGDRVPSAALVTDGQAWIDTSSLDGQLQPRRVSTRELVPGGALLVRGRLDLRLTEAPADGDHQRALAAWLDAQRRSLPTTGLARRFARVFVPTVVLVATAAGLWWTAFSDVATGFSVAAAVLLVACPCALGVATPMALWAAAADLSQRGVVVQHLHALERLASTRTVIFDKTGTLTALAPQVAWHPRSGASAKLVERAPTWVAAVQARVDHPVATALRGPFPTDIEVREVLDLPSGGVRATLVEDAHVYTIELAPQQGRRGIWVDVDGSRVARVDLNEVVVEAASACLSELKRQGIDTEVLTGDSVPVALPLTSETRATPADKAAYIRARQALGPVAFVGDAANDLAALATADVSITLNHARAGVRDSSDIHIGTLQDLPVLIDVARATHARLRRLLTVSLTTNAIGIGIAALGWLHPVVAALLMAASSLGITLASVPGAPHAR